MRAQHVFWVTNLYKYHYIYTFSIKNGGEEMAELREMIKQEQSERKDEAGKMDNYFRYSSTFIN